MKLRNSPSGQKGLDNQPIWVSRKYERNKVRLNIVYLRLA
jgi:hypothetical protein